MCSIFDSLATSLIKNQFKFESFSKGIHPLNFSDRQHKYQLRITTHQTLSTINPKTIISSTFPFIKQENPVKKETKLVDPSSTKKKRRNCDKKKRHLVGYLVKVSLTHQRFEYAKKKKVSSYTPYTNTCLKKKNTGDFELYMTFNSLPNDAAQRIQLRYGS